MRQNNKKRLRLKLEIKQITKVLQTKKMDEETKKFYKKVLRILKIKSKL